MVSFSHMHFVKHKYRVTKPCAVKYSFAALCVYLLHDCIYMCTET